MPARAAALLTARLKPAAEQLQAAAAPILFRKFAGQAMLRPAVAAPAMSRAAIAERRIKQQMFLELQRRVLRRSSTCPRKRKSFRWKLGNEREWRMS